MKYMKGLREFFIFIWLSVLLSCSRPQDPQNINSPKLDGTGISMETAIYIAKGWGIYDFSFRQCEVNVIDENKQWKVMFTKKKEFEKYEGGCPTFWIDKETGEIVEVAPNK